MKGNFHVRFLEGKAVVIPPTHSIRYFELRKKDMALLKVNGLSTKDILQILCHQLILGLLVVFILQFVLSYFINARQLVKLKTEEILRKKDTVRH